MLSFLFLRYLSGNYEESAKKELGVDIWVWSLPSFSEFRFISEKSPSNAVEKDLFSM
jgi:hypothetical protein